MSQRKMISATTAFRLPSVIVIDDKGKKTIILMPKKMSKSFFFFKRAFDLVMSFFAIVFLSWLLLIILLVETIATKGHPIFADKRVGKGGKDILVFKFRTMYNDAEENIDKYLTKKQKRQWLRERKVDNDPRVSKHGSFLRKTSLDELPQLFNIFIGTMSFVGPRPMTRREVEQGYTLEQQDILLGTRPGLTGTWQVEGREITEFKSGKRQYLDLIYFEKRSIWYDLKVIFKTIPAVLKQKGAK